MLKGRVDRIARAFAVLLESINKFQSGPITLKAPAAYALKAPAAYALKAPAAYALKAPAAYAVGQDLATYFESMQRTPAFEAAKAVTSLETTEPVASFESLLSTVSGTQAVLTSFEIIAKCISIIKNNKEREIAIQEIAEGLKACADLYRSINQERKTEKSPTKKKNIKKHDIKK